MSSIVDYQNQKESKYSKKKLIEQKDHEIFFENLEKKSIQFPKINNRVPPGFKIFDMNILRYLLIRRNNSHSASFRINIKQNTINNMNII